MNTKECQIYGKFSHRMEGKRCRIDENVCTSINSVCEVEYIPAEGSHLVFVAIAVENVHSIINLRTGCYDQGSFKLRYPRGSGI
jgi:hypothetical protein